MNIERTGAATALIALFIAAGLFFLADAGAQYNNDEKKDASLLFKTGNFYFGEGAYNLSRAREYYKKAAALDPSLPGLHYQLARIHFLRNEFEKAMEEIDEEIALRPAFKKSYYMRGLIQGYAGNLEGAASDFKKFISMDSFNWAGHNDLAWIYFKQGNYQAAKEAAEEGLSRAAGNPWLENSLGIALLNLGDKESARVHFETALKRIDEMGPQAWGIAYPGNNPLSYAQGLREMRASVLSNIKLAE